MVLLSAKTRPLVSDELAEQRRKLVTAIGDSLEALTGEQVLFVVTADDNLVLTPWSLFPVDGHADVFEDWQAYKVWNAPKSL